MAQAPQPEPLFTAERYFALVDEGVLQPDDRVELLEGVVVAMPPQSPSHAGYTALIAHRLWELVGTRAFVRSQAPLPVGTHSVPEPDVAVVPGKVTDYLRHHPTTALLVVEVALTSLPQDRLSKAAIYAAAAIPEYWIVNLRDRALEVLRDPDPRLRVYASRRVAAADEVLALAALPEVRVPVTAILPADDDEPLDDDRRTAR
jgi:Uma2 family endonuclease